MKSGIAFKFNHFSILDLAECVMRDKFPDAFAAGQMEVRDNEKVIGIAGKVANDDRFSIPHGSDVSITADLDEAQRQQLEAFVVEMNEEINYKAKDSHKYNAYPEYKTFTLV